MSPHDKIPLKQIVFHIQDPTHSKFSDDTIKVQTREIEKNGQKTCDFGGRQTSSPIKWGLVVSHTSNIVNKSYYSYARYHSQQI